MAAKGLWTFSGKNKLGLTLPELPTEINETNPNENEYEKQFEKNELICFWCCNKGSVMFLSNDWKKNLNNSIVLTDKKIEWKNSSIVNVPLDN